MKIAEIIKTRIRRCDKIKISVKVLFLLVGILLASLYLPLKRKF